MSHYQPFFTPQLTGMLLNCTNLIAWTIDTGIAVSRPDIVLLYYPPIYNFYWFVSRSLFILRNNHTRIPILDDILPILQKALEGNGTATLLAESQSDTVNNWVYWDDFLGDGDVIDGKVVNNAEDRLFSTSIALNALLDIWTTTTSTCKRQWVSYTPQSVKTTVEGGINFLNKFILGSTYLPENCFFSGSMKGVLSLPFFYPGNVMFYANGTKLVNPTNESQIDTTLTDVVQGYIPESEYSLLLQKTWFGTAVPQTFGGFNSDGVFFPFWSSPAFTYSGALAAISKFASANQCV
eukprot:TRINITY_DN7887_c0_g1_i1.p1 TRINITY_DN7887_c0_g1~~TRINITY_DN7887_c0_g1_i1.p1  ORF type:complete len:294 (-),score=52.08 TRINITY_DN7887_c0_g1_i1:77-958(-)